MTWRRVGFSETPRIVRSASGCRLAATSQKAADDGSPGTCTCGIARNRVPPWTLIDQEPSGPCTRLMLAPRAVSIRSLWSRVATLSI